MTAILAEDESLLLAEVFALPNGIQSSVLSFHSELRTTI
jgi:hypothetical protein